MNPTSKNVASMLSASKRLLGRVPALLARRLELLIVEVEEEREQLLRAILLIVGLSTFAMLAGITLTVAVVLISWEHSPLATVFVLLAFYTGGAAWMYRRLQRLRAGWGLFPATRDQMRKDVECVDILLR